MTSIASIQLDSTSTSFAQTIKAERHTFTTDAPLSMGGGDRGPSPFLLLLAGLATCTSVEMQLHAQKQGWDIGPIHIDLAFVMAEDGLRIERVIALSSRVTAEQQARLAEVAEMTPVTQTLRRGTPIATRFQPRSHGRMTA